MQLFDVIVIGAGAAGLMCAIEAGSRGRRVLILDHANKVGKKILMSGGGRCNFTNYQISADRYISHNPHFMKSALSRYTQWDFIDLVKKHGIAFHEKKHGQLFCDDKAKDIVNMLLTECDHANVEIKLNECIKGIEQPHPHLFRVKTAVTQFQCESLVIATGGLSIPTMGATPFGYQVATQFGIKVWPTRAGLVPFTLKKLDLERFSFLSGISSDSMVQSNTKSFRENMLFTHRGLSGPAILQISSYWALGEDITIRLMPEIDLLASLKQSQRDRPKMSLKECLSAFFAKKLISVFLPSEFEQRPLQSFSHAAFEEVVRQFQSWTINPNGTEGYRTAEVTLGGVDCDALSSKTMEAHAVKGLYFIGEVVDVAGWLGGYNFQWAWSSGWAAGQVV
ncbi:MAG: NAD(P)/FAD-dependent oxidoreductase [Gammaproteobacteria bacterium]